MNIKIKNFKIYKLIIIILKYYIILHFYRIVLVNNKMIKKFYLKMAINFYNNLIQMINNKYMI